MKVLGELKRSVSSRKETILENLTELEKRVFFYALNIYYLYGIKYTEKIPSPDLGEPTGELFSLLDDLRNGVIIGTAARSRVERYAKERGSLIKLVLSGRLDCGVAAKTFNKVHKGYIPTFSVQLAAEAPLCALDEFPYVLNIKYDGVRIIAIVRDGVTTFYTRNGRVVPIPKLAGVLAPLGNTVLDGELIFRPTARHVRNRPVLSGMVNRAIHGGVLEELHTTYKIFDALTLTEWDTKSCPTQLRHRLPRLAAISRSLPDIAQCSVVDYTLVDSLDSVVAAYASTTKAGGEGVIIKALYAPYQFKRSRNWVKMKAVKTADLVCIGVLEGKNKYVGMIGSLVCVGQTEGFTVSVNVGSGLTDPQRRAESQVYIGATIEVRYNEVISGHGPTKSLFLPRFVCVRHDK